MLTLYLANEGEQCPLQGVFAFCAQFNLQDNVSFFKNNALKFYDTIMGFNFYANVVKPHFPQLREHLGEEKFEEFA